MDAREGISKHTYREYVEHSGRYFRKSDRGHIKELDPNTKKVKKQYNDVELNLQASLSHRKARMYGFDRADSEDRF